MNLCEVREWVIDDHVRLKGRLNVIERLTARALSGESESVDSLRFECEMMLADLAQHMRWEDRYLAPVLRWTRSGSSALSEITASSANC